LYQDLFGNLPRGKRHCCWFGLGFSVVVNTCCLLGCFCCCCCLLLAADCGLPASVVFLIIFRLSQMPILLIQPEISRTMRLTCCFELAGIVSNRGLPPREKIPVNSVTRLDLPLYWQWKQFLNFQTHLHRGTHVHGK
jgi:hypothetical protein